MSVCALVPLQPPIRSPALKVFSSTKASGPRARRRVHQSQDLCLNPRCFGGGTQMAAIQTCKLQEVIHLCFCSLALIHHRKVSYKWEMYSLQRGAIYYADWWCLKVFQGLPPTKGQFFRSMPLRLEVCHVFKLFGEHATAAEKEPFKEVVLQKVSVESGLCFQRPSNLRSNHDKKAWTCLWNQQDVNGEKLTMKKWWIFGADLFHGLRRGFHGL